MPTLKLTIKGKTMPRKSKSQATTVTAPGQPYGVAGEQQAAMKLLPLPDTQVQPDMSAPTAAPSSVPGMANTADAPQPNAMEAAIQAALTSPSPDAPAFSAPTTRPEESIFTTVQQPITRKSDVANILRALSDDVGGDPVLMQLAAQAEQQGL